MIHFRMSFECFRRFPIGFVDTIQACPNQYSREALGVRNAFSYVNTGRLEDSNPKAIIDFLIQACDYKYSDSLLLIGMPTITFPSIIIFTQTHLRLIILMT